jgi:tripartite-type tricarboxylate transporter receptor subunit TctC
MKRRDFIGLTAGLPIVTRAPHAFAQQSISRPVTMVVPYSAGGPTDTLARVLGQRMSVSLGQNVIIENVPGGSASIGVGRVVRSAPDGTTIGIGNVGSHVFNGAIYSLSCDLLTDLEPIARVAGNPQLILGKAEIPANTFNELVTWIKAQPRSILIGTGGAGSVAHLSGTYLQQKLGTSATMVPYRGTGPAMQALMAGQIDILFDQPSTALPQVRAKTIKAYAVTSKTSPAAAPEIPSVDAAGLPGFYVNLWHGLWVPKGTPANVTAKLNAAVVDTLADSAVRARLDELSQDIPARDEQTPEGLRAFQKAEIEKWWPIIKAADIKPD